MPIGSGGVTTAQVVASGKVLPVANASGVTVDTTTYDDFVKGAGKLTTLVFPSEQGMFAIATTGDTYPRYVFSSDPTDLGMMFSNGGAGGHFGSLSLSGNRLVLSGASSASVSVPGATANGDAPRIEQLSPRFSISSGTLPFVALVSGAGAQIDATADRETATAFTTDGTNNAASLIVAISPDNLTYTTLDTFAFAAATNLLGTLGLSVNVRVPAGWYLKMTAVRVTIGSTIYY